MHIEAKRLKKELRALERGVEFLDESEIRIENILGDLGEFANCNRYVNYSALRMELQDAINHLYATLRSQINLTRQRILEEQSGGLTAKERVLQYH